MRSSSPTRSASTGGSSSGARPASPLARRQAVNSGPDCSVEYTADSAASPSSTGRRSLSRRRMARAAAAMGNAVTLAMTASSIGSSAASTTSYGAASMAAGIAVDDPDDDHRHRTRTPAGRRTADGGVDDDQRGAVQRGRRVTAAHREQLDQLTGMDGVHVGSR